MTIYQVKSENWEGWTRNLKEARKLRTKTKRQWNEKAQITKHNVPRNKDGIIKLLMGYHCP